MNQYVLFPVSGDELEAHRPRPPHTQIPMHYALALDINVTLRCVTFLSNKTSKTSVPSEKEVRHTPKITAQLKVDENIHYFRRRQ